MKKDCIDFFFVDIYIFLLGGVCKKNVMFDKNEICLDEEVKKVCEFVGKKSCDGID